METQKIVNLLNESDHESSKFATKKWYVINDKIIQNLVKDIKMIQALNLRQKLSNQVLVIIQIHIFL